MRPHHRAPGQAIVVPSCQPRDAALISTQPRLVLISVLISARKVPRTFTVTAVSLQLYFNLEGLYFGTEAVPQKLSVGDHRGFDLGPELPFPELCTGHVSLHSRQHGRYRMAAERTDTAWYCSSTVTALPRSAMRHGYRQRGLVSLPYSLEWNFPGSRFL